MNPPEDYPSGDVHHQNGKTNHSYPSCYPLEVEYRPGRIQLLNGDQEIALKQFWAALLKFWGYPVLINEDDISIPEAFVASSIVGDSVGLSRQNSNKTTHSGKSTRSGWSIKSSKLKKGVSGLSIFSRLKRRPLIKKVLAARAQAIEEGAMDEQQESLLPAIEAIYRDAYHEGYGDNGDNGDNITDSESIQSFHTAHSELPRPGNERVGSKGIAPKTSLLTSTLRRKHRRNSLVVASLAKQDPEVLHQAFFAATRNDLIDNFLLRFLRARKFVVNDALQMVATSLQWRHCQYPVEKWVREADGPSFVKGTNQGFIRNFSVGKLCIRGHDVLNNPLFIFQARKHFAHDSPLAETERFALVSIEWCKLLLREVHASIDTCTVMFDLTNFSLKNTDNAPIKFLAHAFEAHYPESLGYIIVHNASWIFSTVWSVIKNWLDPVVASKIHFTKDLHDLSKLLHPSQIPRYLGGSAPDDFAYSEPTESHMHPPLKKDSNYRRLIRHRHFLWMKFLEATIRWIESTNAKESSKYLRSKILLSYRLSDNYIQLDPYLRNPGVYDRQGLLQVRN